MEQNMSLYNRLKNTPPEARKEIKGGRLKGFTDINPMWRFKMLTEAFGPCGIGWKYEITDQRIVPGPSGETGAFVDILLYFKMDGQWSDGIPGIGGSAFIAKESGGLRMSDECFKMALTDAIGTACKALGMSADIYFEKDRTKYNNSPGNPSDAKPRNPVDDAAAMVIHIDPYAGLTLGEIWKKDIKFIKFLRDDPNVPQDIKNAVATINAASKR